MHTYWRLYVTAINGGGQVSITELEFMDAYGGVDITGPGLGTASASSEANTSNKAIFAFNNDFATSKWASASGVPQWIRYQFNSPVNIVQYHVWGAISGQTTLSPKDWLFQYSDDGVVWTTLHEVVGQTGWTAAQKRTFTNIPIGGNVTKAAGGAADRVLIRDWVTYRHVKNVVPDVNGDWSANLVAGQYDITYLADGCQPITHGPYTLAAP